ncbi:MAG: ABC transporter ATP-binding protein/permease [Deltaproteobacteria bacterium]|jgi:ABC-type multidrug transport system fused ATPase/permease subunit|nr:ABC transporter ATP-binding protein/permease [Deltaproteobacteria bacterium]
MDLDDELDLKPLNTGDIKLLFGLWPYTKTFRPVILLGAVMILLAALVSIALPYLTKVALDGYVLPLGRKIVDSGPLPPDFGAGLEDSDFLPSGDPGVFFVPAGGAEKIDRALEKTLVASGKLDPDRWYLKKIDADFTFGEASKLSRDSGGLVELHPNLVAVREPDLTRLDGAATLVLRNADLEGLKVLAVLFAALMVAGYFFDLGQRVILETASQKLGYFLRERLLSHLFSLSQSFFDKSEAGRLTSRLTSDINNINAMVKSTAASFFSDVLSLVGVTAVMVALSPKLALVSFLVTPLAVLVSWRFGKIARRIQRDLRGKVSAINQYFSETRAGIVIIKALGREKTSALGFRELNESNFRTGLRQVHSFAVFLPLVDFIASSVLALILWFGGNMVLGNAVSLGVLAAFVGYANRFFAPIKDLAEKVNTFQSAFASIERINALFEVDDRTLPEGPVPEAPPGPGGEIAFENVSFAYGENMPMVLENINFTVGKGETVALVGATGSGKSSVINLMLRFYDPTEGRITFDGARLKNLDLSLHRKRIGLVTQDVYLYGGTVMENLKLGRTDIPDEVARNAAERVGASAFIEKLPGGYDEKIGNEGRTLSAGERQLLACARALIDAPEFVILDEATAFVDSESELLISKAMRTVFEGRTSIIIAHRLSTVKNADRILVLNRGRIVEEGSHEDLIKKNGLYFNLARLQSLES